MATIESLKGNITKARTALTEGIKKSEDASKCTEIRKLKKKVRRLTRKSGKLVYFDKMAELKKKKKKDREKTES